MKLGFDIDDTLINLREHAFHIYNKKLQQNVPVEKFHELDCVEIHSLFGLTGQQGKDMWHRSKEDIYYTSCPAYPKAIDILTKLTQQGHEIYYITARPKIHGERTKQWMKQQGFPVCDERFYYGMLDAEKVEIIKQLQLDYYFDDKPAVLQTLLEESVNVYVKDQSYNRHLDLPRIVEWEELEEILTQHES
ncbi:5' nucleotidase, NT5C type [Aquibacillus sediminis]|uniref:5' nucleotidase, NT5C type n=1 Tax=Aquibacillus sediminis TaxID=2574734 RepID=UPI001108B665|nr:HAD family acid phosphatase [Aquibacillus sediminis]